MKRIPKEYECKKLYNSTIFKYRSYYDEKENYPYILSYHMDNPILSPDYTIIMILDDCDSFSDIKHIKLKMTACNRIERPYAYELFYVHNLAHKDKLKLSLKSSYHYACEA